MPALLTAALIVFLEGLSFGVVLPVLAAYCRELGGDATWAGLLFAAAVVPRVFTGPFWGRMSDRLGRKPMMAVVAIGTTWASLLWALCPTFDGALMSGLGWLMLSRFVYGLFSAQSVLGMAVASDVSTPAKRSAAIGALGAAFGLAFTIGPMIGGLFADHFGYARTGYLAAAFQLLSFLAALLLLKETHRRDHHAAGRAEPLRPVIARPLLSQPLILNLSLTTLLATAAYSVMFPTIEPLMLQRFEWSPREVGYLLSSFGLVGAIVQGGMIRPAVQRFGEKSVAFLGLALVVLGMAGVAGSSSLAGIYPAMALLAIGTGFVVPALSGMMSISVTPGEQGAVHGLSQSATAVGRGLGFAISGFLFAQFSSGMAYGVAAGMAVLGLGILGIIRVNPRQYTDDAVGDELP